MTISEPGLVSALVAIGALVGWYARGIFERPE